MSKIPWLPSHLAPGTAAERCPFCRRQAFIPWTLRRDPATKGLVRLWVCVECQRTEERPEPE